MLDSGVIDVAIGVILVYLLISLLCSAINEIIAARLRYRAKDLEEGIRLMLRSELASASPAEKTTAARLTQKTGSVVSFVADLIRGSQSGAGSRAGGVAGSLFNHPLFLSLKRHERMPSYVAARTFSAVVLDLVDSPNRLTWLREHVASFAGENLNLTTYVEALITNQNDRASIVRFVDEIPDEQLRTELRQAIAPELDRIMDQLNGMQIQQHAKDIVEALLTPADLGKVLEKLADPPASIPLAPEVSKELSRVVASWRELLINVESLGAGLEGKVTEKRVEIEKWFDSSMERVSGWYKRRAQVVLVFLAIPIVFALNADTLTISNSLLKNSVLRDQLVNAASTRVAAASTDGAQGSGSQETPESPQALLEELKGLDILGWKKPSGEVSDPREAPRYNLKLFGHTLIHDGESATKGFDVTGWIWKLFGLGLTVVAVSQGAPFWFDLLKKSVNVRGAGKPPASTAETSTKSQGGG